MKHKQTTRGRLHYTKKRLHNATLEGCITPMCSQDLTHAEQEVLNLLIDEYLTPKQIQIRRQTSHQAIYKIIQKLRQKGAYNLGMVKVAKTQAIMQPKNNQIRLHGQEFNIKIIHQDRRYGEELARSDTIIADENTIRLYKNSVEIYSGHSFIADDPQKATAKSLIYWNRFFARLEHDLRVVLVKPNSRNIRMVNQHYAETNNEFSKECEEKDYRVRLYTKEDGKLWFSIDNSFNLHEAETLHPKTAKEDIEGIKDFFNDIRENPTTMSKVTDLIGQTLVISKESIQSINDVASELKLLAKIVGTQLPQPNEEKTGEVKKEGSQDIPSYVG